MLTFAEMGIKCRTKQDWDNIRLMVSRMQKLSAQQKAHDAEVAAKPKPEPAFNYALHHELR